MPTDETYGDLVLTLLDSPDQRAKDEAGAALYQYNVDTTGVADRVPIGARLIDPDSGRILGGIWGEPNSAYCSSKCFSCPKMSGDSHRESGCS